MYCIVKLDLSFYINMYTYKIKLVPVGYVINCFRTIVKICCFQTRLPRPLVTAHRFKIETPRSSSPLTPLNRDRLRKRWLHQHRLRDLDRSINSLIMLFDVRLCQFLKYSMKRLLPVPLIYIHFFIRRFWFIN